MGLAIVVVMIFGLFTVMGGVMGYLKAKSRPSLIVGTLMGLSLLVAAFRMREGNQAAPLVAMGIAILLGGRFFITWKQNHRMAPDLLMVLISLVTLIVVGSVCLAGL
ncbi:MAG: TMEM14 family protein [Candidatus Omnitrophica bacterium]|nr:TMEM14 family protein [Candidatus Omnitrophota bacterium]